MSGATRQSASREELIREVRALRRALREPSPTPASVSGRNVDVILDLCQALGLRTEDLQAGLPFDLAVARDPEGWIGWDDFDALLERVRELTGDDGLRRLGSAALGSPLFRAAGLVGGGFLSLEDLLAWMARTAFRDDGLYFHGVRAYVERDEPGSVRLVWEVREPARLSRAFALAMEGVVAVVPKLMGGAEAMTQTVTLDPERLVMRVELPERRPGRLSGIWRALRGHRRADEVRLLYTEMVEANQLLQEKLQALEASRAARRELEQHLAQRRQMEVIGRFAATLRHELNNLLTVILNHTDFLTQQLPEGDESREDLAVIEAAGERAVRLVRQLRDLDLHEPAPSEVVDLHGAVEEALRLVDHVVPPGVVVSRGRGPAPASVLADRGGVDQLLWNLVLNAAESMEGRGHVEVRTDTVAVPEKLAERHPELGAGRCAHLSVTDDGPGMRPEVQARIFEPFFTTKDRGHGVGLATVYAVVTRLGGALDVDSAPGRGTRFDAYLPLAEAREARPTSRGDRPSAPALGERRRVLLIEDHDAVRAATARILEDAGYDVDTASSGDDAIAWIEDGSRPDVIVSDVVMPGLRGNALAEALREHAGQVPILFVSGYADGSLNLELTPNTAFLAKPYQPSALAQRLEVLLSPGEE